VVGLIDTSVTTGSDRAMRGMFAARKEVFVDLLGWQVPVLDGRYEIDQFDDEHARYLIVTDAEQRHLASARLLPTTRPHILDTLFPALCAGPIPRGPETYEITRFCLDWNLTAAERREARNRLVTALVEHALANGIRHYTGVAEPGWLNQIFRFGWEAAALGQILSHDSGKLGALQINITATTPDQLKATRMWSPTRPAYAGTDHRQERKMRATVSRPQHAPARGIADKLMNEGWCILPGLIAPETIAALRADLQPIFDATPFCAGDFYGERTKRFGSLLKRSPHAATLIRNPEIMGMVERVLLPWCDTIQLNLAQAIAIHPGAPVQFPHRDQDMWEGVKGEVEYLVNVMWPLAPFTEENGATLIYPGSNGAAALDENAAGTPLSAVCDPGDAIVFLGSTLHGAGKNRSAVVRDAVVVSYCLGWLKPYENQWLVYPPEVARTFDPELAALIGYRQHRPNLGNVEGVCPSMLLQDEIPAHLGAVDALRPDQREAVAEHRRRQEV
jgi:N-acyl-L-homoserine lactone synthetase/ectoine hydroxylase-related dioxygenase (phytanoyl-CoA dioxygenase family)